MRCGDCRHYVPGPEHLGSCHRWRGGDGQGGYGWEPSEIAENEVVVETDEGWGASVGRNFGCVLFEPKT